MIDKTLSYLDYTKIIGIVKGYSATHSADDLIENLTPFKELEAVKDRQEKIGAILEVIKWDGRVPFSDVPDVDLIVKRLSIRDAVLEAAEFIAISRFLRACADISAFLKRALHKATYVEEIISVLKPLPGVYSKVLKTVNGEGFIEDTASYDLSKIRSDLFGLREKIKRQLERTMEKESIKPVLQDSFIAIRNGRYVIPMKPNFNEALQGIVHDYSHSLKTSFVEPVECIEENNAINMLVEEEREEEKRILRELTLHIRSSIDDLSNNLSIIRELDLYHCLALFSLDFNCVRPELRFNGPLEIKGAVNPFIMLSKKDKAVPIDVVMAHDKKTMIISGPNAGGKTAALKTIGLLSVMAHAGFFIPASGKPVMPLVTNVFAIIGDEQDISMELSSFTAHMQTIKEVYERSAGNELILIDEIGGGTEPQEASALSMSIMDGFVEKGCTVIVTTHLNLLKAYGYTKAFAINVATEFDTESMRPLYRLLYGMAGYSNAINVAKNLNLPKKIIEGSYQYMGEQEHMLNDLVSALEMGKKRVEEERIKLLELRTEARKRVTLLKEEREEYLRKIEAKCDSLLRSVETEVEEIRKEVNKKERASAAVAKERLKVIRKRVVKAPAPESQDISPGDYVMVRSLGSKGHVVGADKPREIYEVQIGNLRTRIQKDDLVKTGVDKKPPFSGKVGVQIHVQPLKEVELNVMGMRVDEALEEVDRFIDRAIVQNASRVRILHGVGTGRLMSAIKEHLAEGGYRKNINRDERNSGITVVDLV
jgi:DNA mismatch repair protein MutS2